MTKFDEVLLLNYAKFEYLCKLNSTTPSALAQKLGLSKGNTTTWRKGGNPSVDVLIKLSDELNCSMDYLYDRERSETLEQFQLSENELAFMNSYSKLDQQGKLMVQAKAIEELRRLEDK